MKKVSAKIYLLIISLLFLVVLFSCSNEEEKQPNVIFIITDDQGYGDLACHGNPWIKTPAIDKLYEESIRFTNFHCGTTCAPSRSGIMTGKYCNHVNVWHTIMGRENLRLGEYTIADAFTDNGYKTGLFGKWHLGDGYPYRPQDRGFQVAVYHKAGGVGQAPDYWNNDYFDDTYFRNGVPEKMEGYCTDIWFREALRFIENNKNEKFFAYISTNAPHSPYRVAKKYKDMYDSNPDIPNASFYGMITNLDEHIAVLEQKLEEWGLKENTIFVFTTDNGTAAGVDTDNQEFVTKGYNSGMRGKKGSKYEGGHRVPLFVRWPGRALGGGVNVNSVASYTDLFPTLAELCRLNLPANQEFDGISLTEYIKDETKFADRVIFTDTQREMNLKKWKDCCVMTSKYRLIDGKELYNIKTDTGQTTDIASQHPEIVEKLRNEYEVWWRKVSTNGSEDSELHVNLEKESPAVLSSHDLVCDGFPAWNQNQVRQLEGVNGYWNLFFEESGKYHIRLMRWPQESGLAFWENAPEGDIDEAGQLYRQGIGLDVKKAKLKIDSILHEKEVDSSKEFVEFTIELSKGSHDMEAFLIDKDGEEKSAYYVYIN